ncbi:MAG TPA: hypothetical protein VMN78_13985 [Longimicrobiales bacterium]|nr:hypothetical protein [Longimicrobiales bacterium]
MHREHLSSVSLWPVFLGWVAAIAVTSALVFLLTALGWMETEGNSTAWAVGTVAIGFFVGGYLTGTRDIEAPILHGVGIGVMTLAAWLVLNLLAALFIDGGVAAGLPPAVSAGLLLLQMGAAIAGAWIADRRALRGEALPGERLS